MAVSSRVKLILLLTVWLGGGLWTRAEEDPQPYSSTLKRARVVVVEDSRSMVAFNPVPDVVERMVNEGIVALTGKDDAPAAWRSLVSPLDTIGIKVFSSPGATSGTRPVVVSGIIQGLLAAGIPKQQIVIWDKQLSDLRRAGYADLATRYGVEIAGSADEGYDPKTFYESALLGTLVWGDFEFGKKGEGLGRKSFVSKLITQRLTKIINASPLLNHNLTSVSGNLLSLAFGSVDNTIRFEAALNPIAQVNEAVPEIYALPQLGDRVVLNVVDALICQYRGEERTLLHYSTMLRELRFSTDPVALDVLSVLELDRQRRRSQVPVIKPNWQVYTNATLLEIGVSDPRYIDVINVDSGPR